MKKKVLIGLSVIVFLGLAVVSLIRFLALSNKLPDTPAISVLQDNVPGFSKITGSPATNGKATVTVDQATFEVISKIPQYQIVDNKVDLKQLNSYLTDMGLSPLSNKDFIEYSSDPTTGPTNKVRKADYKHIKITFLPASELPTDYSSTRSFPYLHLYDESINGRLANGYFAGKTTGDTFEIPIYIDPVIASKFAFPPSEYLTACFLKSLFFNFYDQEIKSFPVPPQTFSEKTKNVTTPIFKVITPTSDKPFNLLQAVKDLLIPQVYAGGLCGAANCGVTVGSAGTCSGVTTTTHKCSIGGADCTSTACDVYSGSCVTNTTTTGAGASCSGSCLSGQGTCQGYQPTSCKVTTGEDCFQFGNTCRVIVNCDCSLGSCGSPSCTWGAFSTCTNANTCGVAGTKTRTSTCGTTDTVTCPAVACCGNGSCAGGETCSSCASDCGVCTPPAGPYCGDGSCNNGENCSTCAKDCGTCSCTPSCATSCGQNDGCGGTCSSVDAGAPATPTGQTPANGTGVVTANGKITLSWNPVPKADLYEIQVYPTGTASGSECTVTNHHCPAPFAGNNYVFTADAGVTSYTWKVRAINTGCGTTLYSVWTVPISFTVGGGFSGSFYQDDSAVAGRVGSGLCQGVGTPLVNAPAGTGVNALWNGAPGTNGTVSGTSFSISGIGTNPNTIVTLSLPAGYRCTCPTGCSYSGISVPLGGLDFYITTAQAGWWQTSNGYVYAGAISGPAITSQIPLTCAAAPASCTAAISTYDSKKNAGSDGTTLTGGGVIDSTADVTTTYSYLNQSGTNTHAEGMSLNGPEENYNYFTQLYGITSSTTPDFTGTQPTSDVTHGYYSNGDVTISTPWTLNTTDSIVVFVNGNLRISQPIQVAKGAFVAFIVKGDIIFDKSLGDNTSNAPSVAGVYIADGNIITETNSPGDDLKFIGEGTFVGWTGIQLQRTFNNANVAKGNTQAIETFNFRPDFLVTVPEKMTKPLFLWQETN